MTVDPPIRATFWTSSAHAAQRWFPLAGIWAVASIVASPLTGSTCSLAMLVCGEAIVMAASAELNHSRLWSPILDGIAMVNLLVAVDLTRRDAGFDLPAAFYLSSLHIIAGSALMSAALSARPIGWRHMYLTGVAHILAGLSLKLWGSAFGGLPASLAIAANLMLQARTLDRTGAHR